MPTSKKNFTHQVVYSNRHKIIVTTPKGWARENKEHFDESFDDDDVPRTSKIGKVLVAQGFTRKETAEMVVYHKFQH